MVRAPRRRLLGRLAERSGDPDAARKAYRAALDLAEADPEGAASCPVEIAALHASVAVEATEAGGSAPDETGPVTGTWAPGVPAARSSSAAEWSGLTSRPGAPAPVAAPVMADTLPVSTDSPERPADHAALTPREREVVRLVAQGMTSREVAAALYVTPKAISYHLGNVFAKLGVTSRRQLWGRTF